MEGWSRELLSVASRKELFLMMKTLVMMSSPGLTQSRTQTYPFAIGCSRQLHSCYVTVRRDVETNVISQVESDKNLNLQLRARFVYIT